jgi:hypothetical protein
MNTKKKKYKIKGKDKKKSVPSEETEKQVPVLSHCPCWPIPDSPLSDFLFTNFSHPEYDWNIACWTLSSQSINQFAHIIVSSSIDVSTFPGIPTGDPAIVAFYDKRIYKKLRLKELSLSDPLYHGKQQHRNMTGTIPSIVTFYICACRRRRL